MKACSSNERKKARCGRTVPIPGDPCQVCGDGPCAKDNLPREQPKQTTGIECADLTSAIGCIGREEPLSERGERILNLTRLMAAQASISIIKQQLQNVTTTNPQEQMVKFNAQRSLGYAEESCQKLHRINELIVQSKKHETDQRENPAHRPDSEPAHAQD